MKKFYLLLTLIVLTTIQIVNAQAPQGIPYQAVARDNSGNLIKNQPISLRFKIHDGSAGGTVVYSETHAVTTDALGLFSLNIGSGTTSQTLADVNWGSGAKFTQVELDVTGGSNYADMGTTQMMSVPYALYAGSSAAAPSVFEPTIDIPDAIHNTNAGNVGIGTDLPSAKLDVAGTLRVRGGNPAQGKVLTSDDNGAATWQTPAVQTTVFEPTIDIPDAIHNTNAGNVGIGTDLPSAKLDVAGTLRVRGGNPAQGKVLTSDNNGAATWQTPVAPNLTGYATTLGLAYETTRATSAEQALDDKIYFRDAIDFPGSIYSSNPGNVGIGTDLPSEKLDVAGNLRIRGNVGIGTETPNTSAALEIKSNTGSLLIPRMTTADRNNLNASEGMIIYNKSDSTYQGFSKNYTSYNPTIDQSQLAIDNGFGPNDKSQTFTAGLTGALSSVKVLLNCMMGPQSGTIFIRSGSGNAGSILYQSNIVINYNDGGSWVTINPIGVNVIAGSVYTINIVNQGGFGPESQIDWLCRIDQDNYSGGHLYYGADAFGGDGVFQTTVTPSPTASLQWISLNPAQTVAPSVTTSMGYIGSSSTIKGGTIDESGILSLTPADAVNGGIVTTGNQNFAGNKSFNGYVGIGTNNPTALLNVVGGDRQSGIRVESYYNASLALASSTREYQIYSRQEGDLVFYDQTAEQETNGGNPYRMVINNAGNVGIGTYLPSQKLDVSGNLRVRQNAMIQGDVNATSFVKTGGQANEFLMADGSTSAGTVATTIGSIGESSTANGGTITSGVLNLTPANATNAGVVTSIAQTFGGKKTFADSAVALGFRATDSVTTKGFRATGTSRADSVSARAFKATGTAGADSVSTRAFKATGTAGADSVSTRSIKATGNAIVGGNLITFNPTISAINATATATVDNVISGYITSTSAALTTITLPTATAIATALGTVSRGTQLEFIVDNIAGTNTVTIAGGTGITVLGSPTVTGTATLTIPSTNLGRFRLIFTTPTAAKIVRVF